MVVLKKSFPSFSFAEVLYITSGFFGAVVFIGTMLFALQQLSGINAVFYFSSTVFKSAGVPSNLANMCVGFSNLSGEILLYCGTVFIFYYCMYLIKLQLLGNLPGSVVAMLLMDKLGRRYLLLGSFIGMVSFIND